MGASRSDIKHRTPAWLNVQKNVLRSSAPFISSKSSPLILQTMITFYSRHPPRSIFTTRQVLLIIMPRHMCRRLSVTPSRHSRRSTIYESESDSEFEYPILQSRGKSHSMVDTAIQLALLLFKKSSAPKKKGRACCVMEDEDDDPSRYRVAMDYSNGGLKGEFAVPLFSGLGAPKPKPRFRETVYIEKEVTLVLTPASPLGPAQRGRRALKGNERRARVEKGAQEKEARHPNVRMNQAWQKRTGIDLGPHLDQDQRSL
ncbi:hypothetical protein B0H63DRAFT_218909 [Podospora didyma]|uniref:Uncharacterized protein n=1 Tax=Podospora didyma TaxID=330526 RepID=A0AAE0KIW1_9PEZI|nr:hypothetical protein B0H63DRAFT_218909 [Podospora didyma]